MTSSGTNTFTLTVEEIIEKAFNLIGGELTSGEDLKQARKSLNLLFIDLQNRGHPLAKLENVSFTTSVSAQSSYQVSANVVDLLDVIVTRSSVSTPLQRMSLFDYHKIPDKTITGLPTQYALDRDTTSNTIYLYLTPSETTDKIDYWAVKRIQDAGSYNNTVDFSYRYLPAIVVGLAFFLSFEREGFPLDKRAELKALYQDTLNNAFTEDSERVSFQVRPWGYHSRI